MRLQGNTARRLTMGTAMALAIALVGCQTAQDSVAPSTDDLSDELGLSQVALGAPNAPNGYVDFYMGGAVLAQYAETRTFAPSDNVGYSMIRMPEWAVESAIRSGMPTTISLCDASHGVVLFHQAISEAYRAPDQEEVANCTPWVGRFSGRLTIEYESGQPGVYGFAQVGVQSNSNLFAGAVMDGALPGACANDTSIGYSSMRLGTWEVDESPDDASLASCTRPAEPEEGP